MNSSQISYFSLSSRTGPNLHGQVRLDMDGRSLGSTRRTPGSRKEPSFVNTGCGVGNWISEDPEINQNNQGDSYQSW